MRYISVGAVIAEDQRRRFIRLVVFRQPDSIFATVRHSKVFEVPWCHRRRRAAAGCSTLDMLWQAERTGDEAQGERDKRKREHSVIPNTA